jgi:16S rRNA (adenine1518-N6/adenine1519-N6)-dimethyltransferase
MITPKKSFGQNFIFSKTILSSIVDLASIENEKVIEIGPGLGGLTKFICKKADNVIAFELDKTMKSHLDPLIIENKNLEIIYDDFLNVKLNMYEDYVIIGNIPYNISSLILIKFLYSNLKSATILVQKEFGNRLVSKNKNKEYGELSVLTQYFCDVSKLKYIGRAAFFPVPKVDSVLIKLTRIREYNQSIELTNFMKFIKICFQMKRKTLVNNLLTLNNITRSDILDILIKYDYIESIRAEELAVMELFSLSKEFVKWLN